MANASTGAIRREGGPTWALASAVVAGALGLVANAFGVGFALAYSGSDPSWRWLGAADDVAVAGFFLALVPVLHAVRRLLPASRLVTAATAIATLAATTAALLQGALVLGWIGFDVEVRLLVAALVPVYGWLIVADSLGHRVGALPRSVTRLGLLLGGISWSAALALTLAGAALGGSSLGSLDLGPPGALLLVPAPVLGGLNWLALPLWPLLLARTVFGRHAALRSNQSAGTGSAAEAKEGAR